MKHTQGEWEHVVEKEGMNINDVIKHKNQYIATIHVTGTTEECNANAKLIAAAPDLLEALKEILPISEEWINENHPTHKKAIAAIKKATV